MSNTVRRLSPSTPRSLKHGRAVRWLYCHPLNGKMSPAVHVRGPDGLHGFVPIHVLQAAQKVERDRARKLASGVVVATDLAKLEEQIT